MQLGSAAFNDTVVRGEITAAGHPHSEAYFWQGMRGSD